MTQIVVLDGYSLNPGDLDWSPLQQFGELTVYDNTAPEQVLERIGTAELVFTNKVELKQSLLVQLPQLKFIGVLATGVNVVDVDAASRLGIVVTNVPAYGPESVAQMAIAHLLHFSSRVGQHHQAVTEGQWVNSDQFCFWNAPLMGLAGKRFGVVGFGAIAQAAARMARAFNMDILVTSRNRKHDLPEGYHWVEQAELFANADVVSLHCPQTSANSGFVNSDLIATMKPSAFLINTARGGLINEQDLAKALNDGRIAGAGLDVLLQEPPCADNPLLSAKNCTITPHNAWATIEARQNLMRIAVENLATFVAGKPQNQVN